MDHEVQHTSSALRDQLLIAESFRTPRHGCYRGTRCLINPACPLKGGHPLRPGGHGIPQKHCEHGRENDHWNRKDKVDPEQPTELSYMVPMTSVTAMMTMVTVRMSWCP